MKIITKREFEALPNGVLYSVFHNQEGLIGLFAKGSKDELNHLYSPEGKTIDDVVLFEVDDKTITITENHQVAALWTQFEAELVIERLRYNTKNLRYLGTYPIIPDLIVGDRYFYKAVTFASIIGANHV